MKHRNTLIILCFIIGIVLYAYHHALFIIRWPWHHAPQNIARHHATKKSISLHYWHHRSWHTEKTTLIMSDDPAQALAYLVNTWLTLLDEEQHITAKKVELQTALLSPNGHELFLSFDRVPFNSQQSTYESWMWVEGLLKTIKTYNSSIDRVHLLVRHKPLQDRHLDFLNAWPIHGFTQE
ncbi:MAG: hypothetical protein ACHQVS_03375 [Candidatus Babeliales bacterium]